jgi:Na+/proline symporter/signal transduction histidine kinase
MIPGWAAGLATLTYVCALFGLAHFGDTRGRRLIAGRLRPAIYALGLGVYCTSWTFYGSVGLASTTGFDFLPIYIGPVIVIGLCNPFVRRLVRLAKSQNITSVADFMAARYGKADKVAVCVTVLCVVGTIPYIALQLKAIESSTSLVLGSIAAGHLSQATGSSPGSLFVPVLLAGFALAFGTRRVDATEHQDGLMLAVATESIVKLAAFLAVGVFVTYFMFGGVVDLYGKARATEPINDIFLGDFDPLTLVVMTALSAFAILLLPRQFHVTVVENREDRDVRTAAWLFPAYLVAINLFVLPLGVAGLLTFAGGSIDRDMTVLALPLEAGAQGLAIFTMLGGLSAATAMIVVECVALSIMVSNDIVLPFLLRGPKTEAAQRSGDLGARLLVTRRLAILVILALGHFYLRFTKEIGLVSIGLISFACIAQIAPAFFGGFLWRRATAAGALAGVASGGLVWFYTLFLPSIRVPGSGIADLVQHGPFGIAALRPTALFGLELPTLAHGVLISLAVNVTAFVLVSLRRRPNRIERLQSEAFVGAPRLQSPGPLRLWRVPVTVGEIEQAVARYLGAERARDAIDSFFEMRSLPADRAREVDVNLVRYTEHLLASAIGAASSRLALSLVLRRRNVPRAEALQLVDAASAAIQYNRDILQYALDFARQGITVLDRDLQLVCWNREFRDLFDVPGDVLHVGVPFETIVRSNALRGLYGAGQPDDLVRKRMSIFVGTGEPFRLRLQPSGRVIEMRSSRLPDGGLVTTHTDVTEQVESEEALAATNETLEQRVRARTEELVSLNQALAAAKGAADEANLSKTRFLAAASHDILQPLNAACLYASALAEQMDGTLPPRRARELAGNVDAALEAVGEIITALLDISRLDAGAMTAEMTGLRLADLFSQLAIEFTPLARASDVDLRFMPTRAIVWSDRRLLRRLLQNLISNAVKYTPGGRVIVGVRRQGGRRRICVYDTGLGIPAENQGEIFEEFRRLAPAQRTARGLGLGLSIVRRLALVLGHDVGLASREGRGSCFWIGAEAATDAGPRLNRRAGAERRAASSLAGLQVLVIDNEARVRDGMTALLQGWGCAVAATGSLAGARSALADLAGGPDVIVADYHLDEGNGLDAVAALRGDYGRAIPAALVTADRTDAVRAACVELDVPILPKPLRPATLRALLMQWRVTREAAEQAAE